MSLIDAPPTTAAPSAAPDLATFFDVSLDMLCIRDAAFRFVRVNEAWTRTLGHPVEALEGRPMLDFIHPDDAQPSRGRMAEIGEAGEISGFINRYRHADGTYRHLEWRARRVGAFVFGVARDVTERLAAEAEVNAARAAAEAANRAKSDFLANMSHEIRTPLNGVIGVTAALARTPLSESQREMVGLIERSGETLERLVSDVLDVSKIEAGKLEIEAAPFDLESELDGVADVYRLRAHEKGLGFELRRQPMAQGVFLGDAVRLRQVLGNLLSNAVKFTQSGHVAVDVEVVADDGEAPGQRLRVSVSDTGVGFPEAFARELFDRFAQADGAITRRFGGTGLGLAICRSLVAMMGGQITAESRPGEGSRFTFELPLAPVEGVADEGVAAEPAPVRLEGRRVLLAEDHPINQRVVELILAPFGVDLTIAPDGAAALSILEGERFDLILMDMQMPGVDGLAATRTLRAREAAGATPPTPVLMLSANAMREHREAARAAGADAHLAKPVTAEALVSAIAELLEP